MTGSTTAARRLSALTAASFEMLYRVNADWSEVLDLYTAGCLDPMPTGEPGWVEAYVAPVDQGRVQALIREAVRTQRPFRMEYQMRRTDGSVGWVMARSVPLVDRTGCVQEWLGAAVDTSLAQREAARIHDDARRQAQQLLATLAHQLRNPLAAVQGSTQILRHSRVGSHAMKEAAPMWDILDRQLGHLVHLVDALMDLSSLSAGTIQLDRQITPIGDVVETGLELCERLVAESSIDVVRSLPAGPVYVVGDHVRLADMLANLIANACEHTPPQGRITVAVDGAGDTVSVTIADTGSGIPPALLPHVFDPFVQGEGQASGLGIGLSLAREVAELHGGTVEAQSDGPGRGSRFVVRLPRAHPPDARAGPPVARPLETHTGHRVLVVDDNRDLLEVMEQLLHGMGIAVRTTAEARAVLPLLRTFAPSVVLLDLGMAPVDGCELARTIRRDPDFDGITLIALTGWGDEETVSRSRAAGMTHHLVKPLDLAALQAILQSLPVPGAPG